MRGAYRRRAAAAFSRRLAEAGCVCATLAARHDATQWAALQHELGEWLQALPKPVGVMACDDVRARHILEACASVGLRVPHEVAVIGVDDDEFVCELSDPPLSRSGSGRRSATPSTMTWCEPGSVRRGGSSRRLIFLSSRRRRGPASGRSPT